MTSLRARRGAVGRLRHRGRVASARVTASRITRESGGRPIAARTSALLVDSRLNPLAEHAREDRQGLSGVLNLHGLWRLRLLLRRFARHQASVRIRKSGFCCAGRHGGGHRRVGACPVLVGGRRVRHLRSHLCGRIGGRCAVVLRHRGRSGIRRRAGCRSVRVRVRRCRLGAAAASGQRAGQRNETCENSIRLHSAAPREPQSVAGSRPADRRIEIGPPKPRRNPWLHNTRASRDAQ